MLKDKCIYIIVILLSVFAWIALGSEIKQFESFTLIVKIIIEFLFLIVFGGTILWAILGWKNNRKLFN